MKKILNTNLYLLLLLSIIFTACEQHRITPLSVGETPEKVSDITIEYLPGAAKIRYKIPKSNDFLYTKIVYETKKGVTRTIKSSLYERFVLLEGFAEKGKYPVKIYSVSKGEVESDPVSIDVDISEPPYITAYKDLKIIQDFGGITVQFSNDQNKDIGVNVSSYYEKANVYRLDKTYRSKVKEDIQFKSIGYTKNTKFLITTFDRFGNISDSLYTEITPLEEFLLDKSKFKSLALPPFYNHGENGNTLIENLWNNELGGWYYGYSAYMSPFSLIDPNIGATFDFAIDIGQNLKLSRFKLFHPHLGSFFAFYFSGYTPKVFEIWGSNNPNKDGSWDSWTKIGDFKSKLPEHIRTEEDVMRYAFVEGEDYSLDASIGSYRYYRFKIKENWGSKTNVSIDELTFWGGISK